jgi:hypothetical protein
MNLLLAPLTRTNHERRFGGSKLSNKLSNKRTQVQQITVDQDSSDVKLWIDGSGVSIGSINTGQLGQCLRQQGGGFAVLLPRTAML